MVKFDDKVTQEIDLLVISYISLKVLTDEKIDINSYYFKYYVYVMIWKIGIDNIDGVIPKEFYKYINGNIIHYDKLHEDGIDVVDLNGTVLKRMIRNINHYYFNGCEMDMDKPSVGIRTDLFDFETYFKQVKSVYNKYFELVVNSVDCVDVYTQIKLLKIDLDKAVKVEAYMKAAKIKKEIDKLEGK